MSTRVTARDFIGPKSQAGRVRLGGIPAPVPAPAPASMEMRRLRPLYVERPVRLQGYADRERPMETDEEDEELEESGAEERIEYDSAEAADAQMNGMMPNEDFERKQWQMIRRVGKQGIKGHSLVRTAFFLSILATALAISSMVFFLLGKSIPFLPVGNPFVYYAFVFVLPVLAIFPANALTVCSESLVTRFIIFMYNLGCALLSGMSAATAIYRALYIDVGGLLTTGLTISSTFTFLVVLVVTGFSAYLLNPTRRYAEFLKSREEQ